MSSRLKEKHGFTIIFHFKTSCFCTKSVNTVDLQRFAQNW